MSTTTAKPATTPIPVQLSEPEFSAFIGSVAKFAQGGMKGQVALV